MAFVVQGPRSPESDRNPQRERAELYSRLRGIRGETLEGYGSELGGDRGNLPPDWHFSKQEGDKVTLTRKGDKPDTSDSLTISHGRLFDGERNVGYVSIELARTQNDAITHATSTVEFALADTGEVLSSQQCVTFHDQDRPDLSQYGPFNMQNMDRIQEVQQFIEGA